MNTATEINEAASAAVDIVSETNVNVFWSDLVTAYDAGAIPVEYFRVEATVTEYPAGMKWVSYRLYLQPDGVISALQAYLVKRQIRQGQGDGPLSARFA